MDEEQRLYGKSVRGVCCTASSAQRWREVLGLTTRDLDDIIGIRICHPGLLKGHETRLVAIRRWVTLCGRAMMPFPEDSILTGAPTGVALFMEPPEFLESVERVRCEIAGVGAIESRVREEVTQSYGPACLVTPRDRGHARISSTTLSASTTPFHTAPPRYAIDRLRTPCSSGGIAASRRRPRARARISATAFASKASRWKSHGPSDRGWSAFNSPCSTASPNVRALIGFSWY